MGTSFCLYFIYYFIFIIFYHTYESNMQVNLVQREISFDDLFISTPSTMSDATFEYSGLCGRHRLESD